ncbi:hypothetical protein ASG40_12880 [Methylobacterium sp. Leaf399]|uniref:hypothetical protein n=1 Tax=Methylobacterium sp. Leaf399 TaxID=1736364 RepID=UPI0006FE75FD|nr:hypothetical protein [Methylobacterium sp. Leaf399]KQT07797.1 hypothetical protein ASG40_12880 [Methylobacterium sp. Leaf399]
MSHLRQVDLDWFVAGDVSPFALAGYLADPRETRIPFSVPFDARFTVTREAVRFLRGRRFVRAVDCQGEPDDLVAAYLIPAIEGGWLIDWIAWHPRSGRLATLEGCVGLLGGDAIWRASRDEPLVLAADPRAWLAGWRTGACIVDETIARQQLLEVPAIQAPDVEVGRKLKAMLEEVRLPRIVVPVSAIGTVAA